MTDYYVNNAAGYGGSDSNAGTSDAAPKLTFAGVVAIGLVAGDVVHIAGGCVFREELDPDANGSSGNEIEWIVDTRGEIWPALTGLTVITGSDDDVTITRAEVLDLSSRSYHVFEGLALQYASDRPLVFSSAANIVFRECVIESNTGTSTPLIAWEMGTNITFDRCLLMARGTSNIDAFGYYINMPGTIFRHCIFGPGIGQLLVTAATTSCQVLNCTFEQAFTLSVINGTTPTGIELIVEQCFGHGRITFDAAVADSILEDNNVSLYGFVRNNVDAGAGSAVALPAIHGAYLPNIYRPYTDDRVGSTSTTRDIRGVPVYSTPTVGALEKYRAAMTEDRVSELVPPDCLSSVYYAAVEAGKTYDILASVFGSAAITNQPILRCETALGITSTSDTATDAETGSAGTPAGWEVVTFQVSPTATGSLAFWVENPDPTVSIDVALAKAVEA